MKPVRLLIVTALACLLMAAPSFAATVLTDAQIAEITTIAQAGGDLTQAAEGMMSQITSDLIAQGLSEGEIQAQIAVAMEEMASGLDAGAPGFETQVGAIMNGGTAGAVQGVNLAVGANPNLNPATLTSSVTSGAARAAGNVGARTGISPQNLQAAVNQGAQRQGAAPAPPEAFAPATPADTPPAPAPPGPVTPPAPPTVGGAPPVETPPTGKDIASN